MYKNLRLEGRGNVPLVNGLPKAYADHTIVSAKAYHAVGDWGIICLQEVATPSLIFQYYFFHLKQTVSIYCARQKQKLQSLISLNGSYEHRINGLQPVILNEKEFLLFHNHDEESVLTAYPSKRCTLINAHHGEESYRQFLPYFPAFRKDLQRAVSGPRYFTIAPKVAKYSVHDAIHAIWIEKYIPRLLAKSIELQIQKCLLTQLAQTYSPLPKSNYNHAEKVKSEQALAFILKDIKVHYMPEQVAAELFCTAPWLKKAFSKVYGLGLFQYLRKTRMLLAREKLLRGESLKEVAIDVGMKPQNFPKEFKAFFGYTVTDLKNGER